MNNLASKKELFLIMLIHILIALFFIYLESKLKNIIILLQTVNDQLVGDQSTEKVIDLRDLVDVLRGLSSEAYRANNLFLISMFFVGGVFLLKRSRAGFFLMLSIFFLSVMAVLVKPVI